MSAAVLDAKPATAAGSTIGEQLSLIRPYLMRFARSKLGDAHVAEDLVQDTIVAALVGKSPFLGQSALRTWMISILKHKIADYYRAAAVRRTDVSADLPDEEASAQSAAQWPEPSATVDTGWQQNAVDPQDEVEKGQMAARVMKAISRLPSRQRDAFVLVHMHGYSSREAATRVGVSCANLWIILHRTRKTLQSSLQHSYCA